MRNIKWVGIIDNISKYQCGDLSENAVKLNMPKSMNEMMIKALPFVIPSFVIIFLSMFLKTFLSSSVVINPFFTFIGFLLGFAGLFLHEYLHAIVYPKEAKVYIGIYPKSFAAVAIASFPLSKMRFIAMSLSPIIVGIVPLIAFYLSPATAKEINGLLFGFSIMGLTSPYTDFYNVYKVIKQTPPKCKIQFYEDDIYYIK